MDQNQEKNTDRGISMMISKNIMYNCLHGI